MEPNGHGRIHVLNNGRSPAKKSGDFVTRSQVEAFVQEFTEKVILPKMIEICEHYMKQIPGLTATMLADAFTANGLEFKPPVAADLGVPESLGGSTDGNTSGDASGGAP